MRPIFLDFESNKAGDVFLVGVMEEGYLRQIVLADSLKEMADYKGLEVMSSKDFIEQTIGRANELNCPIAAYSMHDSEIILTHIPSARFRYINMLKAAKKWIRSMHLKEYKSSPWHRTDARPHQPKSSNWALKNVSSFAGFPPDSQYGNRLVTKWIEAVVDALQRRGGDYERLTPTQKSHATKLLKHNKFDVEAIAYLYDRISVEAPRLLKQSIIHP